MSENPEDKRLKVKNYSHSLKKAREKYDMSDPEKRRQQKRDYMRRKRLEDPNYCKWK
jgi:hypothetical protein